jgi:hypothetical protein
VLSKATIKFKNKLEQMPKATKILTFIALVILANFLLTSLNVQAATQLVDPNVLNQDTEFIKETGLGTKVSLGDVVSRIIKILLSFLGVIFFLLMVYAGFTWMMAAGNEEKVTKAKKIMASAVIGLAIVIAAYTITYFVIDKILEATKGSSGLD